MILQNYNVYVISESKHNYDVYIITESKHNSNVYVITESKHNYMKTDCQSQMVTFTDRGPT